jgi:hypothetical protein
MRELFGHSMEDLLGPPRSAESTRDGNSPLGRTPVNLDESSWMNLADQFRSCARIDAAAVDALAAQTNHLRLMDRRIPGPALALQLAGHVNSIRWLLAQALQDQVVVSACR